MNPRSAGGVELNVTAMLDMAFQLLAFFVLTYQSVSEEAKISLRLPPPQAIKPPAPEAPTPAVDVTKIRRVETLLVSIAHSPGGAIDADFARLARVASWEVSLSARPC